MESNHRARDEHEAALETYPVRFVRRAVGPVVRSPLGQKEAFMRLRVFLSIDGVRAVESLLHTRGTPAPVHR